jgi:hypothetical protein
VTTNVQIIGDALKLLGVIGESEDPNAAQGAIGLRRLNQMLELWTEDGIDLGWYEQTLPTADAPLPKWAELGVTSKLAQVLQPLYPSSSLVASVLDDSQNGYGVILRKVTVENAALADTSNMPLGSGHGGDFDIESGW